MDLEKKINHFNKIILKWWEKNKRNFPWREAKSPLKILCAEIMLQQTQAQNVERVYNNFFHKYNNIYEIDDTSLSELQSYFKKLGLIKRAKYIKELSNTVIEKHNGEIPDKKMNYSNYRGLEIILQMQHYVLLLEKI